METKRFKQIIHGNKKFNGSECSVVPLPQLFAARMIRVRKEVTISKEKEEISKMRQ